MITQTQSYFEIVSQLPEAAEVTFHNVCWEEYEELIEQVGEAAWLRISFGDGALRVMTISSEHEYYSSFVNKLLGFVAVRLRINVKSFGSATMKKKPRGIEPDASFYVQTADIIGNRIHIDFATDPPPDIVLEVDIHHDSRDKDSIYSAFGVPELWRFDGQMATIHLLVEGRYQETKASRALPVLSGEILTKFLARLRDEGELAALTAFDGWLTSQHS